MGLSEEELVKMNALAYFPRVRKETRESFLNKVTDMSKKRTHGRGDVAMACHLAEAMAGHTA